MRISNLAYVAVGIVSIALSGLALYKGEVHGLGANGTGDIVYYDDDPKEFLFTTGVLFIFGAGLIYIAIRNGK